MTRDETAIEIGRYFGLQHAGNIMPRVPRGDEGSRVLNALRAILDAEMAAIEASLPPGAIEAWPDMTAPLPSHAPNSPLKNLQNEISLQ